MTSSMVSLGVWVAGWLHSRATQPMEVVTISIYVIPEASSCTMQLVHNVATVGSPIASDCMCFRGTSKVVTGDGPPHRQAITSSKPGGRATTCIGSRDLGEGESHSACSTCKCSSVLWHQALLASELQWQCLCFTSPKMGEACPMAETGQEGCSTFSQPGNWLEGATIFAHSLCGTWGVVGSSRGPLMGAVSSMATSSVVMGGASLETVNLAQFLKNPSSRVTLPKMISSEKEMCHSIISHNLRMDLTKRCG